MFAIEADRARQQPEQRGIPRTLADLLGGLLVAAASAVALLHYAVIS